MGKKVISFSLWGENPIYNIGAIKNADLASKIYKGWECWFYTGASTPESTLKELNKRTNSKVIQQNEDGDWSGMFWRFWPASDPSIDIMISRDTDSRLNHREFRAVGEWMSSKKNFHIMRDHPHHGTEILGGMWGCKYPILKNMKSLIEDYKKGDFWQVDQNFLREKVYPIIKDDHISHDPFFERRPFPTQRREKFFVGQAFDENDAPLHPEHMDPL